MGGMMVTSKQSKTSTVTITGAFFHFCFFFVLFRERAVHTRLREEKTLSLVVVVVGVDQRTHVIASICFILTSVAFLFLSRAHKQANTSTSSPGTRFSKASATANRSRRTDLPSEGTNGSSCFTRMGSRRKTRRTRRSSRRRKIRIARYLWR